jgi:two-component sensor histidine kinase
MIGINAPFPSRAQDVVHRTGRAVPMPVLRGCLPRHLVALIIIGAAVGVRLIPGLPLQGVPFITIFPAIVLATFLGGRGPGLLAVLLGTLGAWFFLMSPTFTFRLTPDRAVALATFVPVALMDWGVVSALLRSLERERALRRHADRLARDNAEMAAGRTHLLQELRHRVGNSLQAVASLLDVEVAGLPDAALRPALRKVTQRVRLFLQAQGRLLEADMPDFGAFLRDLAEDMAASSGADIRVDAAAARLPAETAIAVALIAYELISAQLELAEPPDRPQLALRFTAAGGQGCLTLDCPGRHAEVSGLAPGRPRRLLLSGLLDQIGGRLETPHVDGKAWVRFPLPLAPGTAPA